MQQNRQQQQSLLTRAQAALPAIRVRADQAERARYQPVETMADLVAANLCGVLTPQRWQGEEADLDQVARVILEIARADASAGWCYAIAQLHSLLLAHFPEQAQQDVWHQTPSVFIATALAPSGRVTPTEGGYLLRGRWPWSNGIDHAEWFIGCGYLPAPDDAALHLFLVPRKDLTIEDDWRGMGLRATGSKSVRIEQAVVPSYRVLRFSAAQTGASPGSQGQGGPLQIAYLTVTKPLLLAVMLGVTLHAYEHWREHCPTMLLDHHSRGRATTVQVGLVKTQLDAAMVLFQQTLRLLMAGPQALARTEQRIQLHTQCVFVAERCFDVVERMYRMADARILREGHPLQGAYHDAHAILLHPAFNANAVYEQYGCVELGQPLQEHDPFS